MIDFQDLELAADGHTCKKVLPGVFRSFSLDQILLFLFLFVDLQLWIDSPIQMRELIRAVVSKILSTFTYFGPKTGLILIR